MQTYSKRDPSSFRSTRRRISPKSAPSSPYTSGAFKPILYKKVPGQSHGHREASTHRLAGEEARQGVPGYAFAEPPDSRSDHRFDRSLDSLLDHLPALVQEPPAKSQVLALDVPPLLVLVFGRQGQLLGIVQCPLEIDIALEEVGLSQRGLRGYRIASIMQPLVSRRRRSPRRQGRQQRRDVACAPEERELDVRLQGQEDENIDRSDEAGERCSKKQEEGATVKVRKKWSCSAG